MNKSRLRRPRPDVLGRSPSPQTFQAKRAASRDSGRDVRTSSRIQKQILDTRRKIRDLANEYGATVLDPLQEQEMAHINADPLVEKLSSTIVQMELDLIAAQAQQTNLPASPDGARREAVLSAFKQKLEDRRLAVAEEFDGSLDSRLKEAARQ